MPKDQQPNWPANIAKINIAWSLAIIAIVAGVSYRNYLKAKHPEAFAKPSRKTVVCGNCGARISLVGNDFVPAHKNRETTKTEEN